MRKFKNGMMVGIAVVTLCSTGTVWAMGSSSSESKSDAGFRKAEKAVKAKEFDKAIPLLQDVLKEDPTNADALNYLGYSQRKTGKLDDAMKNYNAALAAKPDHKATLEYQGELFLMLNDKTSAEANLEKLKQLCKRCDEREALQAALDQFTAAGDAGAETIRQINMHY